MTLLDVQYTGTTSNMVVPAFMTRAFAANVALSLIGICKL